MPLTRRGRNRAAAAVAAAMVILTAPIACTPRPEVEVGDASSFATQVFAALGDRDAGALVALFDEASAIEWPERDLAIWLRRTLRAGGVTALEARVDGRIPEPETIDDTDEVPVDVPYSITYDSRYARRPIVLRGSLQVVYDAGEDAWELEWDTGHLWPGIVGAADFTVTTRYAKRGTILDRNGNPLATGPAEARRYPAGSTAGSTIGHLERVTARTAPSFPGRAVGDLVGGSGLEAALEDVLAGEPAARLFAADALGERLRLLGSRRAVPGRGVRSTLDLGVQRAAAAALGSTVGGAAVLDPRDGDLLAVVSSSEFNPANFLGERLNPFNRALSGRYPPGSSLKVMTSAAALDTGVVTRNTVLSGPANYRGVRNFESGEFGRIDFGTALKYSVNTAFAQVARRLGSRRLFRYAERFGFNRAPKAALEAATSSFPMPEDEGDLMWGSIGQAQVVATPLQMATVAATVANDGVRMEPRIVLTERFPSTRVMTRRTARVLTELMRNVVLGGTGFRANIVGADVAGKTGTAELDAAGELNHAWFIAFAPAGDPKIALAVVAELGGVGGEVAAPIAGRIIASVLPQVR